MSMHQRLLANLTAALALVVLVVAIPLSGQLLQQVVERLPVVQPLAAEHTVLAVSVR